MLLVYLHLIPRILRCGAQVFSATRIQFCNNITEYDHANMIKKPHRSFKILRLNVLECNYSAVMVPFYTYILD